MKGIIRQILFWLKSLYAVCFIKRKFGFSGKIIEELRNKYYFNTVTEMQKPKGVVVMFDGKCVHGGLTDRFRGIVSVYSVCKKRGIPFYINYTHPFNLSNYLTPNMQDWTIMQNELSFATNNAEPFVLYDFDLSPLFHRRMIDKVVSMSKGKQLHVYTNVNFADSQFRVLFYELFRPTYNLQKEIQKNVINLGTLYISVSFRFTTLLGDFTDTVNEPLPDDKQEELISKCIVALEQIRARHKDVKKVLVTSDSEKFNDRVRKIKYVYIIPGKVGHFDYSEGNEMVIKTFLDFFLISNAQKVYLVRIGKMYNSGFARHAALLGSKPFELVQN